MQNNLGFFSFIPTYGNIRIVVTGSNRFALTNLHLDRDYVDMQIETYFLHAAGYRYGFNGMEKDDEAKGNGNSYTTEFRQYDPRLGRWLSIDPLMDKFPWQSPYCSMDNNPIYYNDPMGMASEVTIDSPPDWYENEKGEIKYFEGETRETISEGYAILVKGKLQDSYDVIWNKINYVPTQEEVQANTEYLLPEMSWDSNLGVSLLQTTLQAAAEGTAVEFKYVEAAGIAKDAHIAPLKQFSKNVGNFGTFFTIADKSVATTNALLNGKYEKAAKEATLLTGYSIAAYMMAAPTGVTQIAGGALFLVLGVYDLFDD